jgi:hypothetical protein
VAQLRRKDATEKAAAMLYSLYKISTCSGIVLVKPRTWPDTTETAPNSPIARALQSNTPYNRPHRMFGRVTRQNVCQPLAPSESAVSSSSLPCDCMTGMSSRATNGKVTKIVASTIPGTAKTMWMPCACRNAPNQPLLPNSRMKTRPAMTGDTANGRSISVTSALLPRNSNFAIAHAAATPKIMLSGTVIAATNSVSLTAAKASGSDTAAT